MISKQTVFASVLTASVIAAPFVYIAHSAVKSTRDALDSVKNGPAPIDAPGSTDGKTGGKTNSNIKRVAVGELVRLDSAGDHVAWTSEPVVGDIETYGDNNEKCVISFRKPGRYVAIGAKTEGGRVTIHTVEILVGEAVNPSPGPVPSGDTWGGKLAVWLNYDITDQRIGDCQKLAQSFRTIAEQVESRLNRGDLVSAEDIIAETSKSNATSLAGSPLDWNPAFAKLAAELKTMATEGKLVTMKDHVTEWRKIATAFASYGR